MRLDGVSNWKLTVRREGNQAVILNAVTCDTRAVLPETLFGLPVTALGVHALSPGWSGADGEAVEIACGRFPDTGWDNAGLEELTLPASLERIGTYGLYSCRALHTLRLSDRIRDWGGGLTGCRALRRFFIGCSGREGAVLDYLARTLPGELDVTLCRPGGEVRLIFPKYPAHYFDYNISSASYGYHHFLYGGRMDLHAYDALWPEFLRLDHDPDCAVRLAWLRLQYPADLSEQVKGDYLAYVQAHAALLGRRLVEDRDAAGLRALLDQVGWSREALSGLCGEARRQGFTEGLTLLLEAQRRL